MEAKILSNGAVEAALSVVYPGEWPDELNLPGGPEADEDFRRRARLEMWSAIKAAIDFAKEKDGGGALMEETALKREAERAAPIYETRPPSPGRGYALGDDVYINAGGRVTLPEGAVVTTPGGKRYVVTGTNLSEDPGNRAARRKARSQRK
jgi:hypothetical protein